MGITKKTEEDPLKELSALYEIIAAEEILDRVVVKIGNGAHINIPLKHLGKKAKVIIKKEEGNRSLNKKNHN